jgi:hypothetical protein
VADDPKAPGELIATADIPVSVAAPTPDQERSWVNRQIPYRNFAGMLEELDGYAVQLVKAQVNGYRMRMSGPMRRWALNWRVANGDVPWVVNRDDIHLFEAQKAVTSKVARVEEQILQFDPPLEIESDRDELSRRDAKVLAAWTHRLMENAEWSELIQPTARSGELCNQLIVKVSHERRRALRVHRSEELIEKRSKPYWRSERRMREEIVRRRVRFDFVDPFWFFYDLEAKNIQEAAFAGDESEPLLHHVQEDARLGLYSQKQVEQVLKNRSTGEYKGLVGQWTDEHRRARSIALGIDFAGAEGAIEVDGGTRVRQIEAYVLFDFGDGYAGVVDPRGVQLKGPHQVVVTIVDGVCVRLMLNPNDSKLVPYAFANVNKNGAGAVAPAVFDAVTQMNHHLDRFGSNVMRWIDLLVQPIGITTDMSSELPRTMTSAKAGSIFRNTGPVDWMKVPDITTSVSQLLGVFRREMEETSGEMRVFESPQGTATETERKVQEQQRLARASFRASSDLWEQVALLTQRMAAQFSTGPERFAAVGKASAAVGTFCSITPDVMLRDVRFRMIGMKNLHVLGTRAQGMGQWTTQFGALLPAVQADVNLPALMKQGYELLVGRAGADTIFGSPESPWETWSQTEENAILLSGQAVDVHPLDDDQQHMRDLDRIERRTDLPRHIRELILEHKEAHAQNHMRKMAEQAAAKAKAQRSAELMAPAGGQPGQDRPPSYGGMPAQKDQGVSPGPNGDRSSARTGRSQPMSQSTAMAQ